MPIFDFICKQCGKRFEALVYGSREPQCPKCHGEDLEQLLSAFACGSSRGSNAGFGGGCGGGG